MALGFMQEENSLRGQVIIDKYGIRKGSCYRGNSRALWGVPLEDIRNGYGNFYNYVFFKVGDESRIHFWHDV
jgi:hypothetical protein